MYTKFMMLAFIIVVGTCPFTAVLADNVEGTGNELWQYCDQGEPTPANESWVICISEVYALQRGFFTGMEIEYAAAAEKWMHISNPKPLKELICMPKGVTRQQSALVVRNYLKAHPEQLNEQDIVLVLEAEEAVWPCPKDK